MPSRNRQLYIDDIVESISAIQEYVDGLSYDEFVADRKTYSAMIREYMIIGEAVGNLMEDLKAYSPEYPWQRLKDFRNLIVHEYFGVDFRIIWDLTQKELPILENHIQSFQNKGHLD
ncbi:hypothetical protein AVO42_11665 [Thiomicrospira sp. XS5]|uniref:HepT-like ribonuclease domain-containing protein n=1 Tax=Thiomicrospira sp. XS5 TaxID=1775636 RepID=UPI00074613E5|nr:DUF86 domain-containing protein [Thiomicrospira sp. XS5]KUJ75923.1 hypothetical protein AVO42_11665 [Thiomicrospira sp. XS5]